MLRAMYACRTWQRDIVNTHAVGMCEYAGAVLQEKHAKTHLLHLIDADDYGFCNACGIEIGIKRLEARPTATLFIDCKTLDEIKEKQHLGS